MPSTDEQASLLATPSVGGEKHPRVAHGASRTLRGTLLSLAGVFAVLACSSVVVIERQNALRQAEVDSIFARSSAIVAQQSSYCDVCAVVIPSDTYKGKNLGSFIDSADCVVRFNAHRPGSCSDDLAPEDCPSDTDYGTKDDIRIMNANSEMIGKLNDDPCFGPEDQPGACRRGIVTWLDEGMEEEMSFFREHPRVEVVEGLYSALDLPDAHELIRGFAYNQTREAPAWASSAFIALNLLKDPRMCSKMYVFGLTTDDSDPKANTGYADDPDKYISPAHDYVLEHDYYKMAVEDDWPGWDNVKYVQMEHPIGSAK